MFGEVYKNHGSLVPQIITPEQTSFVHQLAGRMREFYVGLIHVRSLEFEYALRVLLEMTLWSTDCPTQCCELFVLIRLMFNISRWLDCSLVHDSHLIQLLMRFRD